MSTHHTFDTELAVKYGINEAILISHFAGWIKYNKRQEVNFKDGRTWTYQSKKQIQASLPFFSYESVKYYCEKLVEQGVLVTANYNKSKIDKTLWYAFANEDEFVRILKNVYDGENSLSSRENSLWSGEKSPTNTNISNKYIKEKKYKEKKEAVDAIASLSPSADGSVCNFSSNEEGNVRKAIRPSKSKSKSLKDCKSQPAHLQNEHNIYYLDYGDNALVIKELLEKLYNIQKQNNAADADEPNQHWAKECDLLIRVDGYSPEKLHQVLDYIATYENDGFTWWSNVLSIASLRNKGKDGIRKIKKILAQMNSNRDAKASSVPRSDATPEKNKKLCEVLERKFADQRCNVRSFTAYPDKAVLECKRKDFKREYYYTNYDVVNLKQIVLKDLRVVFKNVDLILGINITQTPVMPLISPIANNCKFKM